LEIDSTQGAGTLVRAIIPIVDGEELLPAVRVVSAG